MFLLAFTLSASPAVPLEMQKKYLLPLVLPILALQKQNTVIFKKHLFFSIGHGLKAGNRSTRFIFSEKKSQSF